MLARLLRKENQSAQLGRVVTSPLFHRSIMSEPVGYQTLCSKSILPGSMIPAGTAVLEIIKGEEP